MKVSMSDHCEARIRRREMCLPVIQTREEEQLGFRCTGNPPTLGLDWKAQGRNPHPVTESQFLGALIWR